MEYSAPKCIRTVRKGDWKLIKCDVHDGKDRKTHFFSLDEIRTNSFLSTMTLQ